MQQDPEAPHHSPHHHSTAQDGHPPSIKGSVRSNQVAPMSEAGPPSGHQLSFAYLKKLPGIMRLITLVVVIIATCLAHQTYPLKLFHIAPSTMLYSHGKIDPEGLKHNYVQQGVQNAASQANNVLGNLGPYAPSGYSFGGRAGGGGGMGKGGSPGDAKYIMVNPFMFYDGAGYTSEIDYRENMYTQYQAYYGLTAFVAAFIIGFIILMMLNVQVGNRTLTKWVYGGVVGGFLLLALILGAATSFALSCSGSVDVNAGTGAAPKWESMDICDTVYKATPPVALGVSRPFGWIVYYGSVALTGIGMILGIVTAFLFP